MNEWSKNGKPVYIKKLKLEDIDIIEKISGTTKDGINIISYVNLNLKNKLSFGKKFFIKITSNGYNISDYDNNKTQIFYGKINKISNNVDYRTGMYVTNLKLDKSIKNIVDLPNFFTCYIISQNLKNIILLPSEIVKNDNNGEFVFKIENNKAIKQYIKSGYDNGHYKIIEKGLKVDDKVVIEGWSILEEGDIVEIMKEIN
jgi:hypothetical protein